jgi:hypothetical protein
MQVFMVAAIGQSVLPIVFTSDMEAQEQADWLNARGGPLAGEWFVYEIDDDAKLYEAAGLGVAE